MTAESTYFRKGFGLKTEVEATLTADYDGHLVDLGLEAETLPEVRGLGGHARKIRRWTGSRPRTRRQCTRYGVSATLTNSGSGRFVMLSFSTHTTVSDAEARCAPSSTQ